MYWKSSAPVELAAAYPLGIYWSPSLCPVYLMWKEVIHSLSLGIIALLEEILLLIKISTRPLVAEMESVGVLVMKLL